MSGIDDKEVSAINSVLNTLKDLNIEEQVRVVNYARWVVRDRIAVEMEALDKGARQLEKTDLKTPGEK